MPASLQLTPTGLDQFSLQVVLWYLGLVQYPTKVILDLGLAAVNMVFGVVTHIWTTVVWTPSM